MKIILEEKKSKLANLKQHDCIVGDPDNLVDLSVAEWDREIRFRALAAKGDINEGLAILDKLDTHFSD